MVLIKRDGRKVKFNPAKIRKGIKRAAQEIGVEINKKQIDKIIAGINKSCSDLESIEVDNLQDIIEKTLVANNFKQIKTAYSNHRKERDKIREMKSEVMKTITKIGVETDRDNANVGNNFSAKLLRIASTANKWNNLALMPRNLAKLHENGDVYTHDLDSFNLTINCLQLETGKILKKGFNTGYGTIRPPKRIESAAELSCILLQASQNDMFGGQSHVNFNNDLAPYIEMTRQEIKKDVYEILEEGSGDAPLQSPEYIDQYIIEPKVEKAVRQAMQSVVYNLNSMASRAGSQVPFSSINLAPPKSEDAALLTKVFLEEYNRGLGKGEQCVFPNIIYQVKSGFNKPGDKYYYLSKLAFKVAARRMNPTFMNLDFFNEYGDIELGTMGWILQPLYIVIYKANLVNPIA